MESNISPSDLLAYELPSSLEKIGICGVGSRLTYGWFQFCIGELIWWDRSKLGKKDLAIVGLVTYTQAYGLLLQGTHKWWLRELNLCKDKLLKFTLPS